MTKLKILLISPCFSRDGTTGLIALKNLQALGHEVKIWDCLIQSEPPEGEFDVSITWMNKLIDLEKIKSRKKILYYLEDTEYIEKRSYEELNLSNRSKSGYDYIFTMNLTPGQEDKWIPLGTDQDLYFPIGKQSMGDSILFLGTGRDNRRKEFVKVLQLRLREEGIRLYIVGNEWYGFEDWAGRPFYFSDFSRSITSFKICINLHAGNLSPSDKVHAINGVGGALLLNDNLEGYKKCYPMAPTWDDMEDCVKKIKYYLEHEEERKKIVLEMQEKANKDYTYKVGLEKMLNVVMGDLKDG